ncbi:MAG: 30S ribosomal protein S14 [Proteobacteria bacterium]|nr:30S ribosomal protein S14 [Pseudomonadota bacterium]
MAKTSKIVRNEQRIATVAKYAAKRKEILAIVKSAKTGYEEKLEAYKKLRKLPRNACPNRVVNRCKTTGRPRGFYRKFGLCRLELRKKALAGELPGVTKSSW